MDKYVVEVVTKYENWSTVVEPQTDDPYVEAVVLGLQHFLVSETLSGDIFLVRAFKETMIRQLHGERPGDERSDKEFVQENMVSLVYPFFQSYLIEAAKNIGYKLTADELPTRWILTQKLDGRLILGLFTTPGRAEHCMKEDMGLDVKPSSPEPGTGIICYSGHGAELFLHPLVLDQRAVRWQNRGLKPPSAYAATKEDT